MNGKLNLLIVEDSEDDALLELHEIRRGGYDPEYKRVDTAVDMKRALSDGEWDVIIADHKMPHFNSIDALALLKESGKDIPFIIVSAVIGEEAAVALMKAGANDYVRKDGLKRLVPAIEREMADAEVRRLHRIAETMLKQEQMLTNSIIESLRDGFSLIDPAGVHIMVNDSFCAMTGFPREELISMGPPHPNWPEEEMEVINRAYKKTLAGDLGDYEVVFKKKDGRRFPVIVSTSAVRDVQGRIVSFFAIIKDITERKRREMKLARSEARYHSVVEDTPLLMCRMLPDCTITFANHAFGQYYGVAPNELIGANFLDHVCAGEHERVKANLASLDSEHIVVSHECRVAIADQKERWQRWINRAVFEENRLVEYQSIGEDITDRKRMEDELQRQLKELKRWQAVMLDREDRVMELKKEVNDLLREAGRPPRYSGS